MFIPFGGIKDEYVHVQSVLPQEDVIALKTKAGESSSRKRFQKLFIII